MPSSILVQYVSGNILKQSEAGDVTTDATVDDAVADMRETVRTLRALGKKVVLIAPPPALDIDIGLCLERRDSGKLTLGPHSDCTRPFYITMRRNSRFLAQSPWPKRCNWAGASWKPRVEGKVSASVEI